MGSDTLLLMRLYWRLDWRQSGERPIIRFLRIGLLLFGGIALAVISGFSGYGLGLVMNMPEFQQTVNQGLVPGALLTLILLTVLITGPNQAVRALYLSNDLDQLVVAPIETRAIMVSKLLSRLSWNILFILLLAGPALATFGVGLGAGPGYFVSAFILLLAAPLFGLSIGALIAMFLVRWLPAKRLGELLAAAYALVGIMIALLFQLPRFLNVFDTIDEQTAESVIAVANTISKAPIPTLWAGQGMIDIGQGQLSLGLGRMVVYLLMTLGLFAFTVVVSDRLYLPGWLRMQGLSAKRRGLTDDTGRLGGDSLTKSLAAKDWFMRIRDPRQLVGLIGGAVIAIVVGVLVITRGSDGSDVGLLDASQSGALELPRQYRVLSAAFSPGVIMAASVLFIGYTIFGQLALSSMALERQAYAILKTAPVTGTQVWQAKTLGVWLPFAVVATLLFIGAWVIARFSIAWGIYGWICLMMLGVGVLALNTSAGFRFANLEWTDTRRMTSGGGSLYAFILSAIYILATGLSALMFFVLAAAFPGAAIPLAVFGLVVVSVGTAVFVWSMSRWSESAWRRLGEP